MAIVEDDVMNESEEDNDIAIIVEEDDQDSGDEEEVSYSFFRYFPLSSEHDLGKQPSYNICLEIVRIRQLIYLN